MNVYNLILNQTTDLLLGEREKPPAETPDECKKLMKKCWKFSPNDRDDFKTIDFNLEIIYKQVIKVPNFQLSTNTKLFPNSI